MKIIFITLVLLISTSPCFAVEYISSNGKNHIFGIDLGLGSIDPENFEEELDTESIVRLTYGYQYNSTWSINTGLIFGNGTELCIVTCPELRTLSYTSYILNIKGSHPLNNRWSVFGKLGVNYYDLELSGANQANVTDNGIGPLIATGFDFRAYNGFGLGIELSLQDMAVITSTGVSFNFSYMF
ncbi:hypothetical protein CXF85_21095 [Colwellia sp. 75C3]|uniref:outer membrane beta-barrel protein n=1 Tax=Colwellia sp. 75C3 TaxID=888425 RepID=UPI000C32C767|nr:outer membrane beta-barrel protein [Colwellia sp. 75C3]PKG80625.1 hypothetical protein CXF85_21095 [Colwellia sp. 75C3]